LNARDILEFQHPAEGRLTEFRRIDVLRAIEIKRKRRLPRDEKIPNGRIGVGWQGGAVNYPKGG
jgi:hypothetical protein